MKHLVETALLTHGLRSVTNRELESSWHCPEATLAWVDRGELKLGTIGEYLPFREMAGRRMPVNERGRAVLFFGL